ncbi:hypothetical protein G3I59_16725 [Amycolatopsis rubida]|uniref:PPE domain-containing protein n=1 Tax=Amycolatopsis rubida TaxID=112413 RepID=A0ABX0BNH5_9PSEU|nr:MULTISPECIES: hypothetical protein [Amycolatopsis]MYW92200.1 hypothetical protein [Amycolatopsis rubida]NEC57187.1 hypothetical protein [Amycolatopsis rubida]OAP27053.1 hypothetical protein A4R44_01858 [Amycolatopsis sp. M39]
MGNDANTAGKALQGAAVGAAAGSVAGPVGAVVGGAVGGLVGLMSGGPEAQQQSADLGGRSIDAYTIYEKINAGDTTSLDSGVTSAKSLGDAHDKRATEIDNLNKKMDGAWQGGGATAAQAGAHPLKTWLEDSVSNLSKSHTFLNTQAECFHTVKGKVQSLPKDPPSAGFLDGLNPMSDKDDEINKYNDNSKANVQAYTNYFNASGQNASKLPQYSAWQGNNLSNGPDGPGKFGGGPSGGPGGFSGGPGGGGGSFSPPKVDTPKFDPNGPNGPHTNVPTPSGPGQFNDPNGPGHYTGPNDSTSTSGWTPPTTDPSKFSPSTFGPGGGASQFGPGGGGGGAGTGAGTGAGAAFGPGAFGGAGFGPGGSGSGAAAGGAGAGAGAGGMSGMRGGAAGKAGAAGMGGMGAGAKGGKGQEDEEHQTKYLVEEDANELFGSDQMTVPPVIGE